jgi:hypothetical protein
MDVFFGNYREGTDQYGSEFTGSVVRRAQSTGNLEKLVRVVVEMEGTPEVRGLKEEVRAFNPDLALLLSRDSSR